MGLVKYLRLFINDLDLFLKLLIIKILKKML